MTPVHKHMQMSFAMTILYCSTVYSAAIDTGVNDENR